MIRKGFTLLLATQWPDAGHQVGVVSEKEHL